MNKLLSIIVLGLLITNISYSKVLELDCSDTNGVSQMKFKVDVNRKIWSNYAGSKLEMYIDKDDKMYIYFEKPPSEAGRIKINKSLITTIEIFDGAEKNTLLSAGEKAMNKYLQETNENPLENKNNIKIKIFYDMLDNFNRISVVLVNCGNKVSNQNAKYKNLYDKAKTAKDREVVSVVMEISYGLIEQIEHMQKCVDEYNLYNNTDGVYCESFRFTHKPNEGLLFDAGLAIGSEVERLSNLYEDSSNKPIWFKDFIEGTNRNLELLDEHGRLNDKLKKIYGH